MEFIQMFIWILCCYYKQLKLSFRRTLLNSSRRREGRRKSVNEDFIYQRYLMKLKYYYWANRSGEEKVFHQHWLLRSDVTYEDCICISIKDEMYRMCVVFSVLRRPRTTLMASWIRDTKKLINFSACMFAIYLCSSMEAYWIWWFVRLWKFFEWIRKWKYPQLLESFPLKFCQSHRHSCSRVFHYSFQR